MNNYRQNLLEQLRLAVFEDSQNELTDANMVKAMTVNEELKNLGYCLTAPDIVKLARSDSLETFYPEFRKLIPDVEAKPMYPNFPTQVLEIDEATFRFHQICHYMSTYGVEELAALFGQNYEVRKGWLPEVEDTEKTVSDDTLLKAKTLELINTDDMYSVPFRKLLAKTERLTAQELEIIEEALVHVDVLSFDYDIPFKQNMMKVFWALFNLEDHDTAVKAARSLCQHTGDVLKCLDYCLTHRDYSFTTSEKKMLVKLIESYPVEDWKANVILSNKKARRTIQVLQYLSYNRFSRSEGHKEVVRALRNGELSSWESQVKAMLSKKEEGVIDFIAKRPGMLVRWTNWLVKLGYDSEEIKTALVENSTALSTKTLALACTLLGKKEDKTAAYDVLLAALKAKLSHLDSPFRNRKVFIDEGRLDLGHSMLLAKGDEAGYVRNGLAYKIPEDIMILRFFVYWNDKNRVDIDLHASGSNKQGLAVNVGWDSDFRTSGVCHSGDITHSDAAEFVDANMEGNLVEVQFNVNLYYGRDTFDQIDKCFIGLMAVKKFGKEIKLYDPKNCFFYNEIRSKTRTLNYGYVNVQEKYLCLDGTPTEAQWMDGVYTMANHVTSKLTLSEYLRILMEAQNATVVDKPEDAEIELVMEKPEKEGQISLIDNNFFFE